MKCAESKATARKVLSCPSTAKGMIQAARRKKCSQINHTCTAFKYHCLVNAWLNETLEVCGPDVLILGKISQLVY